MVVAATLLHPLALVTIRLYVPAIPDVAVAETPGLCTLLVYPSGPVHAKVVLPTGPLTVNGEPAQTGLFEVAVDNGKALTTTMVVAATLLHPLALVTIRLYVPAIPAVAVAAPPGLCTLLVYPSGPVHA